MSTLTVPSACLLPENSMWTHRFRVRSSSSSSEYIIAQAKIGGGGWACSCKGWCNRRVCKHVLQLGLPPDQAPSNVQFVVTPSLGASYAIPFENLLKLQTKSATSSAAAPSPSVATPKKPAATKKKPPVMLAETWNGKADPTGWWYSEKLDGVRAWWNGTEFISRGGIVYEAPAAFKAAMPRCVLDGELWIARGQFARASGIARGGNEKDWEEMKFMVFDAPEEPGTLEQRLMRVYTEVQLASHPRILAVAQNRVQSLAHLRTLLAEVEKEGGEGLMIRRPGSAYPFDVRSPDLLKVLTVQTAEATVIGYTEGKGNREDLIGALRCRLPNGIEFKVGTGLTYKELANPPAVGTLITFGFKNWTEDGKPREPRYVRVRED